MNHPPQRAFTLIELLVVIAIISILAALAVAVSRQGPKNRARDDRGNFRRAAAHARRPDARGRSPMGRFFRATSTDTSAVGRSMASR